MNPTAFEILNKKENKMFLRYSILKTSLWNSGVFSLLKPEVVGSSCLTTRKKKVNWMPKF